MKAFPKATSQAPTDGEAFSNANVVVSKLQIPKHKSYQTRCEHIVKDCFEPNKGGMESKFTEKVCDCLGCCDGDPSCYFPVTYNKDSAIDERRRRRLLSGTWTSTSEKYYEWYYSRQAKRAEEKWGGAAGEGGLDGNEDGDEDEDDDDDDDDDDVDDDGSGESDFMARRRRFAAGAPSGIDLDDLDAAYDQVLAGVRNMRAAEGEERGTSSKSAADVEGNAQP